MIKTKIITAILKKYYPLILIAGIMGYGYITIQTLEARLHDSKERVEEVSEKFTQLSARYQELDRSFDNFVNNVKQDLNAQRKISEKLVIESRAYADDVQNLREIFENSPDGSQRNYQKIIDRKPTLLERLANDATKEIGNDFKNIDR